MEATTSLTTPATYEPRAGAKKRPRAQPASQPQQASSSGLSEDKSLRHFSLKVCQVVEARGVTTYNEVADDLVLEVLPEEVLTRRAAEGDSSSEERNVRRRVYDALNVLMAMDIIEKDKKSVRWLGFTDTAADRHLLLQRQWEQSRRIELKQKALKDLIAQRVAYTQLVDRNRARETAGALAAAAPPPAAPPAPPAPPAAAAASEEDMAMTLASLGAVDANGAASAAASAAANAGGPSSRIHLPFVLAKTATPSDIDCALADDRQAALLTFSQAFELIDDSQLLRTMKMHEAPPEVHSRLLPAELLPFAAAPDAADAAEAPKRKPRSVNRAAAAKAEERDARPPPTALAAAARAAARAATVAAAARSAALPPAAAIPASAIQAAVTPATGQPSAALAGAAAAGSGTGAYQTLAAASTAVAAALDEARP